MFANHVETKNIKTQCFVVTICQNKVMYLFLNTQVNFNTFDKVIYQECYHKLP